MSEHWYRRDGSSCYETVSKNGNVRATTLADARKYNLCPSVTTVLGVLAKPALETWRVKQGILAALTLPRLDTESDDEYLARVLTDSGEQARKAADEGTKIHDAIECSFHGRRVDPMYRLHVEGARAELARLFPNINDWIAERSFAHPIGFAGKVDLHSPSTGVVVDWKSTDEKRGSSKRFHWDQDRQLAAYQYGLGLPGAVCANAFVSRSDPGAVFSHVWSEKQIVQARAIFLATLEVWKRIRGYDGSFAVEVQRAA